ncbi:MAG: sigma 54-interacting transcriptional regulator [Planctomycetota bacterium]
MDRNALRDHVQAAARQLAPPLGEGTIEWDYSRLSRALGLVGKPGLSDLPHGGVSVLELEAKEWDTSARVYEVWAAELGWGFTRLSARPTAVVPDPVVHSLGVAFAGSDSLIFARASRARRPRIGARKRSAGCSLPLAPGERWLIASDRVRRKCRATIAQRGQIVFIDSAEWLTGASVSNLSYLITAHTAWRNHMLSSPAKCYFVFAAPPGRARLVHAALEGFGITGDIGGTKRPFAARSRAGISHRSLRVESEHILSALEESPFALGAKDVGALFGASGVQVCRELADSGFVLLRTEAGEECFVPNPAATVDLPEASDRVRRALFQHYRERRRRAHEHVTIGALVLALRMNDAPRAQACLGRIGCADAACMPHVLLEEIEQGVKRMGLSLRTADHAVLFAARAHLRDYAAVRERANEITATPIANHADLVRFVRIMLSVGRGHLDAAMPEGFWSSMTAPSLDPALADSTFILCELFAQARLMTIEEIEARFDVAKRALKNRSNARVNRELAVMLKLVQHRVEAGISARHVRRVEVDDSDVSLDLARTVIVPAYVTTTALFAELQAREYSPRKPLPPEGRFACLSLMTAAPDLANHIVQLSSMSRSLIIRGRRFLLRELGDHLVLSHLRCFNRSVANALQFSFQSAAGGRLWSRSALSLLFNQQRAARSDGLEASTLSRALLCAGDIQGARRLLEKACESPRYGGISAAEVIQTDAIIQRTSLDWDRLRSAAPVHVGRVAPEAGGLSASVDLFLAGCRALVAREFCDSEDAFHRSAGMLRPIALGEVHAVRMLAIQHAVLVGRLRRIVEGLGHGGRPIDWVPLVRRLLRPPYLLEGSADPRRWFLEKLDYLHLLAEELALRSRLDERGALGLAALLWEVSGTAIQESGRDLFGVWKSVAPAFHSAVARALDSTGKNTAGMISYSASTLRILSEDRLLDPSASRGRMFDLVPQMYLVPGESASRRARRLDETWPDDAVLFELAQRAQHDRLRSRRLTLGGHLGTQVVHGDVEVRLDPLSGDRVKIEVRELRHVAPAPSSAARASPRQICESPAYLEFLRELRVAAQVETAVLCSGETGSGKEYAARMIHRMSARADDPFVPVDCGSLAESVVEVELFGCKRGAFTGAEERSGLIGQADGATLFLDRVESMSPRVQVILLRVLESGEYRRVGGEKVRRSDFRVIAGTSEKLHELVADGRFRLDLYYRLGAMHLRVPPLRERENDAAALARHFAVSSGKRLTGEACRFILSQPWPGNVRQLKGCIEVSAALAETGLIGPDTIKAALDMGGPRSRPEDAKRDPAELAYRAAAETLGSGTLFETADFARVAEVSRRSAQRHLRALARAGLVVRIGAGRGTRYRIATG